MTTDWKRSPEVQARMDAVAHPTLPIQRPLKLRLDGCAGEIWAPGNIAPWRIARLNAGSEEAAAAYGNLFTAAPELAALVDDLSAPWRDWPPHEIEARHGAAFADAVAQGKVLLARIGGE